MELTKAQWDKNKDTLPEKKSDPGRTAGDKQLEEWRSLEIFASRVWQMVQYAQTFYPVERLFNKLNIAFL